MRERGCLYISNVLSLNAPQAWCAKEEGGDKKGINTVRSGDPNE